VTGVRRSYTTRELLANISLSGGADGALPALLERADLGKFARASTTPDEAAKAGETARAIVDATEARIVAAESAEKESKEGRKLERAA
jgi:hypothetical protein